MKTFLRYPLLLCTALALSLNGPGVMAADRKHSDKKKSHATKRDDSKSSRHSASAHRSSGNSRSSHQAAAARHSSSRGRDQHATVARHSSKPEPRHLAASSSNRSTRLHPVTHSSTASRHVASSSHRDNSSRSRASASHSTPRASSSDRHHSPAVAHRSGSSHHRDRSHYVRRHENHSHDWYRTNGWSYDRDYYTSNHIHRYYNDSYGSYIIVNSAPTYYTEPYSPAPQLQYRDFGSDYSIRLDVQEALANAGYYNGPIDGDIGPGTRNAIARFQYDQGLPVTGRIDEALLDSLGLL